MNEKRFIAVTVNYEMNCLSVRLFAAEDLRSGMDKLSRETLWDDVLLEDEFRNGHSLTSVGNYLAHHLGHLAKMQEPPL